MSSHGMAQNLLKIDNLLANTPTREPKFYKDVESITGEHDKLADPRASRALVALMNQHAVIGGAAAHWGGPAAFAEIMSSIHAIMFRNTDWHKNFHFVNDAGHTENGIYALRSLYNYDDLNFECLKGFRSVESKLTGHGEAHLNPGGVLISNGPLGSGLPQAQGLCLADRAIGNQRVTLCTLSDGGAMEGEAREAMAAISGLAAKEKMNPFVLLISDNNTKLSGRIADDSYSMGPTFKSLEALGWKLVEVEDGHDLKKVHQSIEKAIEDAKSDSTKPVAIRFKTIKGFGVKSTEQSASGGHGYPLKPYDDNLCAFLDEIYNNECPEEFKTWANEILESKPQKKEEAPVKVKAEKVQPGFARACERAMNEGFPLFSVTADLQGSTGIAPFQKAHPERTIDVGVAESNMISSAIGLSKAGFIPMVDTFAQFGITKGNLPLIMANLSEAPVICLFSHTGFQDAADGASHQATTYMSAVSSIPHTTVICCSCSAEAESYLYSAFYEFKHNRESPDPSQSYVFFYGRENFPTHYNEKENYSWRKAQVLKEGDAATIVATGPMVRKALAASEMLEKEGINVTVINNPFVNNPDVATITHALEKTNSILLTIEDHQVTAGMGAMLGHALLQDGQAFKMKSLGINGEFGQSAYKADHLYKKHHLDEESICKALKDLM